MGERLEQRGARVEVVRAQDELPDPREFQLIVPLGSDDSSYDESVPYLAREFELLRTAIVADVPVFGICFGAQLLSRVLGGRVHVNPTGPEIGWLPVHTSQPELVAPGPWLVWHLDVIAGAPPGAMEIANTSVGTQAFVHGRHIGLQFHPEATVDSATIWAEHYRKELAEAGVDYDALLAETRECAPIARERAHALTDRVLEHTKILSGER
ncbi:type 1 glutamine amidotransferase [Tamaricihabitans halophyticus]|uniref:type 1 glutamine amidotransferase n=1 Tax=Tamaricihabitans halophyticus TaxID=1262583 RepID=UPI0014049A62|nr:type 1 glutamine amidotransferase [Tamaricihabitans halophyticus]